MKQLDIFETGTATAAPGMARRTDPETSHRAAESVNASRLEILVLNYVAACPLGATCGDIVDGTGLAWNTISPRLAPLREKGLIRVRRDAEGNKVKRIWRQSRRQQLVWEVM